jgi:putative membrane protein
MNRISLIICFAAVLFAGSCTDDNEPIPDTVSATDRTFILSTADGGMFEVKAGELAVAKGDTTRYMINSTLMSVRTFGQSMITDHTIANEELKTLADRKQVGIPATLSAAKQQKIDSLSAATGSVFNTMYARMMVASHQETISIFEAESINGDDNGIKSWASGKIPSIKDHLNMAVMMRDSVK